MSNCYHNIFYSHTCFQRQRRSYIISDTCRRKHCCLTDHDDINDDVLKSNRYSSRPSVVFLS